MFLRSLDRLRFMSAICKLGAWLILVAGLIVSIIVFLTLYSPQNPNPQQLFLPLALSGIIAILVLFFALCLFALGVLLEYVEARHTAYETSDHEANEMDVQITSLSQ